VDVGDPLLVAAPVLHHRRRGFLARVEDADGAVAVAGAEDVAGDLVGGEGCDAGAGAGGDVLSWVLVGSMERESGGWTYAGADLRGCVPYSYHFHVSGYEQLTLALLPVQYQSCVFVTWDQVCQCAKSRHELDTLFRFIVAEYFDHAVG